MNDRGFERLTDKEREVLRLVFAYPSFDSIARKLDLTKGAIQARFTSIYKKMGTSDRYEVARQLAESEGWAPYTNRIDTIERVGGEAAPGLDQGTGNESSLVGNFIEVVDGLARFLGRNGASNDLTSGERFMRTLLLGLIIMIVLSLLAASMAAMGNFGPGLATQGIHHF